MITASQIRAARGLVGIGQGELAERSGVSPATLRRMERDDIGPGKSASDATDSGRRVRESEGVQFIPENGGGAVVRLAKTSGTGFGSS